MIQKTIRKFNGKAYTREEGDELIKELDDRTKSDEQGYNSIGELAPKVKNLEENQVTGHEVYSTFTDLPVVGVENVSYKVSNDPDPTKNGFWHWDTVTTTYIKDDDSEVQNNLNEEVAKNNERETILLEGSDAYTHAKRVKDDGGTTTDLTALDEYIRKFRDWNLALFPHAKKVAKLYAQLPTDGNGDAEITRTTPCDTIDKNGNSVLAAVNEPRLDYRAKHVEEDDESIYEWSDGCKGIINKAPEIPYVQYEFSAVLQFTTGDNIGGEQIIYSADYNGTNRISIGINSNLIMFSTYDGSPYKTVAIPVAANTKYNLIVTKALGALGEKKMYLDGVLQTTSTPSGNVNAGGGNNRVIGWNVAGQAYFQGKIHTIQEYNLQLPSNDVLEIHNSGYKVLDKYEGADNSNYWSNNSPYLNGTATINGSEYTLVGNGTGSNAFGNDSLWADYMFNEKVIAIQYEVVSNTLTGTTTQAKIGGWSSAEIFDTMFIDSSVGIHTITKIPDRTTLRDRLYFYLNTASTGGSLVIKNIKVFTTGNVLNLSKGKSAYGEEVVVNGNFKTDSDWIKGSSASIASGIAFIDGTQTGWSGLRQDGILTIGKGFMVVIETDNISSGNLRVLLGGNSTAGTLSTNGKHLFFANCSGDDKLYVQGNASFIGEIKSISVKEASIWRDLDHNISANVYAPLKMYNGFGNVVHGVNLTPNFCSEGGNVINHFLNSGTPVNQTVTGLTIGKVYTFNFGGKGIALIEQVGVDAGGTATDIYHYTFIAKSTSVDITFIGTGAKWANLTDSKIPYNHIPTQGASVAKDADILQISNLQGNNLIGTNEGAWFIQFDENSSVSERSSGQDMLMLTPDLTTPYLSSLGFWTKGDDKIQIRAFNGSNLLGVVNSTTKLAGSKVLMTWRSDTVFVSANGEDIGVMENIPPQAFNFIYNRQQQDTKFGIKAMAVTDKLINKTERIKRTTL